MRAFVSVGHLSCTGVGAAPQATGNVQPGWAELVPLLACICITVRVLNNPRTLPSVSISAVYARPAAGGALP